MLTGYSKAVIPVFPQHRTPLPRPRVSTAKMKTTTENITLSSDLATLSPENLSTLVDTWLELQTSAVEVIQTPTPDMFSFAENSFFFAVILQNEQLPSSSGDSKLNESLKDIELVRTRGESPQMIYAQSLAGSSSSTLVPDGTSGRLSDASMTVGPEGEWSPDHFIQTARERESQNVLPNGKTYDTGVDADPSDQTLQSPGFKLQDDSFVADFAYADNRSISLSEIKRDSLFAVHVI